MRKKYLSALLFGALLFASAGTFTSCKDYDDDINNLQEQINTINTTLTELKSQIGTAGVSSVTFDEATGMLTVVDGTGTKSYNIATSAASMVKAEIKDGVLTVNGEEVGPVVGEVTVEGGKLMVDGKEVATLGGENGVSLVKNEDNQTYTLTVGGTSVVLPANADAATTPSVTVTTDVNSNYSTYNVNWGVAASEITFGETKIAAGSLLLGGMNKQTEVTVSPITYDLSAQTLKLVDADGGYAEVKVEAIADEFNGTSGSRAASHNGKFNIVLTATDKVTKDNITTIFTKKVNGVDLNAAYALEVNGTRVTGYDFVIDTQTDNESANNTALEDGDVVFVNNVASVGTTTMKINNPDVVSSYLKLEGLAASEGEAYDISVNGMTITADSKAVGRTITVTLYTLDVTGKTTKHEILVQIAQASVSASETVQQVECAISADGKFKVDFGKVFEGLDSEVVLNAVGYTMSTADPNFFALAGLTAKDNYYPVEAGVVFKDAEDEEVEFTEDLRTIATAEVTLAKFVYDTTNKKWRDPKDTDAATDKMYRTGAKEAKDLYGVFDLNLTLLDKNGNALKNIIVPVKVVAPEFADYYKANTNALWVDGGVTRSVVGTFNEAALVSDDDKLFLTSDNKQATLSYTYSYKAANGNQTPDGGITADKVILNNADAGTTKTYPVLSVVKNGQKETTRRNLAVSKLTVNASATVVTVSNYDGNAEVLPADNKMAIDVKTTFPLTLTSKYANPKLVYYVNDEATDKAVVNKNNEIFPYTEVVTGVKLIPGKEGAAKADYTEVKAMTGLAIEFGKVVDAYKMYANNVDKELGTVGSGYKIKSSAEWTDNKDFSTDVTDGNALVYTYVSDGSLGDLTAATASDANITIADINAGQGGTLVVEFVDKFGIVSSASINYVKEDVDKPSTSVTDDMYPDGVK